MMIELERSNDGFLKSFPEKVAIKALKVGIASKARGQVYWSLSENSTHKLDKDGLLVAKAVIREKTEEPKKRKSKTDSNENTLE